MSRVFRVCILSFMLALLLSLTGCSSLRQIKAPDGVLTAQEKWVQMADACIALLEAKQGPCGIPESPMSFHYGATIEAKLNSATLQAAVEAAKGLGEFVAPLVVPGLGAAAVAQ